MAERACPLCDGTERYYSFLAGDERFEECRSCGLLSHSAVASGPATIVPAGPAGGADQTEEPALSGGMLDILRRYGGDRCRRLGIAGDAPAALLSEAARLGFETTSVPPTSAAPGLLDAVLVHHELENQAAPLAFLEGLRGHLVQGGVLAILTRQLVKASWQTQGHVILKKRQRHSFSDTNLQSAVWKAGFRDSLVHHFVDETATGPGAWLDEAVLLLGRSAPRTQAPRLSIIVPVFNEAATAGQVLDALAAKQIPGVDIEVIVVESNSTDGSREVVQAYRDQPRFQVVLEDRPLGKGYAVRTGFRHATGDVILIQDADLEYDFLDYEMLIEPVLRGRAAFVLGTRHAGHWKIRRFANTHLANLLNVAHWALVFTMNRLYGQAMTDPFTMFKVFRADCLTGLTFECNRFDFDVELVCKLLRKGYRPLEIPVNYRSRSFEEGKKVRMFRDPITWVRAMLKYRNAPVVRHPALERPAPAPSGSGA